MRYFFFNQNLGALLKDLLMVYYSYKHLNINFKVILILSNINSHLILIILLYKGFFERLFHMQLSIYYLLFYKQICLLKNIFPLNIDIFIPNPIIY